MDCKQMHVLTIFAVLLSMRRTAIGGAAAQAPDFPDRMPIVRTALLRGSGQVHFRNYW